MIRNIPEDSALAIISEKEFGHLGCILQDGSPYVVPVNYLVEGRRVFIHSCEGLKLQAMRDNPRACLQVEEISRPYSWNSVIAFGRFNEILDANEREKVLDKLLNHFETLTPVEGLSTADDGGAPPVVFSIEISRLTGVGER